MTKGAFVEFLDQFDDDLEIVIWNGLVNDTMPLGKDCLVVRELFRQSEAFHYAFMVANYCYNNGINDRDSLSEEILTELRKDANTLYNKLGFDVADGFIRTEEEFNRRYGDKEEDRKLELCIVPQLTGKTSKSFHSELEY